MAFSWARANPVGSLRLLTRRPELIGMAGVAFLYYLAHDSLPAVASAWRFQICDSTLC